jgi:hypothetical protein
MVKASYVALLESESSHTVARVRDVLEPTATDAAIAAYAAANDWVVLTADDDFFDETVRMGSVIIQTATRHRRKSLSRRSTPLMRPTTTPLPSLSGFPTGGCEVYFGVRAGYRPDLIGTDLFSSGVVVDNRFE